MTDSRDSQSYKTVVIGTQTWMAQNLNYNPAADFTMCYNNSTSYCATYGRFYGIKTALTVCPTGWHLPDTTEWHTFELYVGGTATAGTTLKSATGWTSGGVTGTNAFGFSALPAGSYDASSGFIGIGTDASWWTATTGGIWGAYVRSIENGDANEVFSVAQTVRLSVRCIKTP